MNYNFEIMNAAKKHLGLKEYAGKPSNPVIDRFFTDSGFPGMTDEVPWCAAFVGGVLAECGLPNSNSLMARSYERYGQKVAFADARPGDIVVLERGAKPFGHVGFFVQWSGGNIVILGGNQGDAVSQVPFHGTRVVAIRRADPSVASGRATVRYGDSGSMVLDLQTRLKKLGYFSGALDQDFGKLTRGSVLAFQADHDLEVDGVVGNRTWAALMAAEPRPQRRVEAADLKDSKIMKAADTTEKLSKAGMVTTVVSMLPSVVTATEQAEGLLEIGSRLLAQHWPLLIVGGVLFSVLHFSKTVKIARVEDAQSGAHLGR